MFNITVFSKDRPAQLDLFLESMVSSDLYTNIINIIYKSSTPQFTKGYDKVKLLHPSVNFIQETSFKKDVLSTISTDNKYTIFFVDDDIWINKFEIDSRFDEFVNNPEILCLSLRLCPRLTKCYPMGEVTQYNPTFSITPNGLLYWSWKNASFDWNYPMSLDGHIFRTVDILPMLENLNYYNPNSLESVLAINPINRPLMSCFRESCIFNNPCNKVQEWNNNRHGKENINSINELFLSGLRLDVEFYNNFKNNGCHQEVELKFK